MNNNRRTCSDARKIFKDWISSSLYQHSFKFNLISIGDTTTSSNCDVYTIDGLNLRLKWYISRQCANICIEFAGITSDEYLWDMNWAIEADPILTKGGFYENTYINKLDRMKYSNVKSLLITENFSYGIRLLEKAIENNSQIYLFEKGGGSDGGIATKGLIKTKIDKHFSKGYWEHVYIAPLVLSSDKKLFY